ncbi:MAG: MarR family transcriptional regulator [Chloroflexota bacterium]|nr:MarR family transcriptional regulator [Chloroflexota bacterium]
MSQPSTSLDFLLAQVCKLHYARVHTLLEELGLYRGQPPVLFALWEQEGATHGELAARLHVKPATITKMITRMERAGFVERRPDPEDQRVSRVYLTDTGHSIRDQVEQVWRTLEEETFQGFSAEERDLLQRFFLQMRENLKHVVGGKPPF